MVTRALAFVAILSCAVSTIARQLPAQLFNPRDDRYRALGLQRAKAEYERASAEWRRARELRTRGLMSDAELEEREAARVRARVDLLQQALAASDAAPHVLIERARKRRLASGATEVELTLSGAPSADGDAVTLVGGLDDDVRRELAAQDQGRLFVSLKASPGADGAIIAIPYERVLPRLAGGARVRTTFRLVRDATDLVVALDYAGRTEERRILLESDGGGAGILLYLPQPAQEADLGAQATYEVTVERVRDDVSAVRVAVEGLPPAATAEVRAADGDARLTVLRFALGERTKRLRVLVTLPNDEGGGVRVDTTLRFSVAAEPTAEGAVGTRAFGAAAARVEAELVPRGIGRAELRLAAGWVESRAGDSTRMSATVRNAGTRALAGVRLTTEAPPGWRIEAHPSTLTSLAVGTDVPVTVLVTPDPAATTGDYEARLRLEGGAGERPLESEPRVLRVHIAPAGRGWSAWLVAGVLALVVLALVVVGKRIGGR